MTTTFKKHKGPRLGQERDPYDDQNRSYRAG